LLLQRVEKDWVIGELSLLAQFDWFFNARASGTVEVLVIDRTAFQKVLETFPEHKDRLIERVIQLRVDRLVSQTTFMLDKFLNSDNDLKTAI
jgi:CRP-like cAMP-binding protein